MQPGEHLQPLQFNSPGLRQSANRINSAVPHTIIPSGSVNGTSARQMSQTLNGYTKPQNGASNRTFEFTMGGKLPMQDATSDSSFQAKKYNGLWGSGAE